MFTEHLLLTFIQRLLFRLLSTTKKNDIFYLMVSDPCTFYFLWKLHTNMLVLSLVKNKLFNAIII